MTQEGLTAEDARTRLERDGPNVLPVRRARPAWVQLLGQFTHFFALMLWAAAALAVLADLTALGVAIVVVILFNGVFAFVQEYRAERAAERLRDLLPRRATVFRDGHRRTIDAADLVVDDVVVLDAGDRISADLTVVEAHGLRVDTSLLTGESEPSSIDVDEVVHGGCFVVEGEATTRVTATGANTRLASIAELTRAAKRPASPLARELKRVVRIISTVAVSIGALFFLLSVVIGTDAQDAVIFALGVTVALVPEGLLPTVTLSLALGAQRMAGNNALVRRLEAVETLGSTTFICTDKTGTLTRNEMSVVEVWTPEGAVRISGTGYDPQASISIASPTVHQAVREAANVAVRCSTGHAIERDGVWRAEGDPMEAAFDVLARRLGADPLEDRRRSPDRRRFPFDPVRRRMSVVTERRVLTKGAPDAVLPRCRYLPPDAEDELDRLAAQGLRVLAVAARTIEGPTPTTADEAEEGLSLLGLLGLEDPPREGVNRSLIACRRAGIGVGMVTGDHPGTADAVAREVGLCVEGDERVVLGHDLPEDEDELGELLDHDGIVIARVSPEQKLRIASALRRRGHVVAMTGDGVNDGPALQEADIGIAMGRSGTDVAREAADLVLLDDHFATIVAAIREGRATFANIRRFLTYHLTDNVAELTPFVVWALSGGNIPLALGVLQILALDIGTDTLSAVALGAEPPRRSALRRPPASGHLLDRTVALRAFGVLGPTEAVMEMTAFFAVFWAAGWRPGDAFPGGDVLLAASGAAFATVVIAQSANAFACRSSIDPPWKLGWLGNRLLVGAVAGGLLLGALFLFVPPVADLLDQGVPTAAGWAVGIAAVPVLLLVDAVFKGARRSALRRSLAPAPVVTEQPTP